MTADPAIAAGAMLQTLRRMPAAARERIVPAYVDALQVHARLLAEAAARDDRVAVRSLAHKMAGAAALVFDQAVLQAAQQLERALGPDAGGSLQTKDLALLQAGAAASIAALQQAFAPAAGS